MKHVIYMLFSILCCISTNLVFSQTVLPSATASTFGKYVDQPVSHFTGTSNVSVPVATVSDGPLSHSVSLDYHTGGIRVGDIPSEVGLGWNLTGGGIITRTIRGIPDDINNGGYWNHGQNLSTSSQHVKEVADQNRDGEPDLFTYSFGPYKGKFIFDKFDDPVMIPKNDLKIQPKFSLFGDFDGFIITTPDGTNYYFGYCHQDWQQTWNVNEEFQEVEGDWSQDISWRLVRIESFDKKHNIDFNYANHYYKYKVWSDCSIYSAYYNGSQDFEGDCEIEELDVYMQATILNKITTPTTEISFFYEDRSDLWEHPNFNQNPRKLNRIEVEEGSFCYKMELTQSYFLSGIGNDEGHKRLKLDQVRKQPCTGSPNDFNSEQPYVFSYHGGSFFPNYLSKRIDHWGYYNGASSNDNDDHLIPYSCYQNQCYGGANRSTSEAHMLKGALQTVIYPTKGKLTFQYEANSYKAENTTNNDPVTLIDIESCSSGTICCASNNYDEETVTLNQEMIDNGVYELELITYSSSICNTAFKQAELRIFDMDNNAALIHSKSINTSQTNTTLNITIDLNTISGLNDGGSYKFKVTSHYGKATLLVTYTPEFINKLCGGLRIKQTKLHDGLNASKDIIRTFNYNSLGSEFSSGILNAEPKYAYQANHSNGIITVIFNSNSIKPLSSLDGYHIGYEHVTADHNGNGEEQFTFEKEWIGTVVPTYPAPPPVAKIYHGSLKQSKTFHENGNLEAQKDVIRNYSDNYTTAAGVVYRAAKVRAKITSNSGWTWKYVHKTYTNKTSIFRPSKIVSLLDGVSTTNDIYYNSQSVYNPTKTKTTNSDGTVTEMITSYTGDYAAALINTFTSRHMIAIPYHTETWVAGKRVDGSLTLFSNYTNSGIRTTSTNTAFFPRPYKVQRYERTWTNGTLQPGSWVTQKTFFQYNPDGLLYKSRLQNWNDFNYYTYLPDSKLLKEKKFRHFTTFYEYVPNTRLLEKSIHVDGTTTSHTYDELMRLKTSTDDCNNIVTTYTYHLGGHVLFDKSYIETEVDHPSATNSAVNKIITRVYKDGLGRDIQTVRRNQNSNNARDLLISVNYDKHGRVINEYKQRQSAYSDGRYVAPASNWYRNHKEYFASPLNRVYRTKPQSFYWTYYEYEANTTADQVKKDMTTAYYPANSLTKITTREQIHNRKNIVFKDKLGRTILSRKTNNSESSSKNLDTYSLYDDKNRITGVFPPGVTNHSAYSNLRYHYEYDKKDNVTKKKVPDAAEVLYLYDSRGFLSAYQDGNLKADNKWYTYFHDSYGRELTQGLHNGHPGSQFIPDEELAKTTYGPELNQLTRDKIIKTESKILGSSNDWITRIKHFDNCGNVSLVTGSNHADPGNLSSYSNILEYDGAFNVTKTTTNIEAFNRNTNIINTQTFDKVGRPKLNKFKVDGGPDKLIANNYFNAEDELYVTYQGHTGLGGNLNYLQAINYYYRHHGPLSSINTNSISGNEQEIEDCIDPDPVESSSSYNNKDIFHLQLFYNNYLGGISQVRQYNGNVSAARWQVKGREKGIYAYRYDDYNRLISADYFDQKDNTITNSGRYDASFTYDLRGNIKTIQRQGMYDEDGCTNQGMIDNISIARFATSNKIYYAHDSAPAASRDEGFKNDFGVHLYDVNGNLKHDSDKKIDISYNHLNLPTEIAFVGTTNTITMKYDAGGNLLTRTSKTGNTILEQRDFVDGIEFVKMGAGNSLIESIGHGEGRVYYENGANPRYEYVLTDHLGNARVWYSDLNNNGIVDVPEEILWEGHYYPFGMETKGPWMDQPEQESKYKYNGIAKVDDFGLDVNMALYRTLDPALGSWWQVDPKAEYLAAMSPYQSMGNNPILYNDPNGDFIPQLVAGVVGGTVNLIDQAIKGNVTSFGEGLAYFGTGAAAGVAVSFGQIGAARAITVGGNKITQAVTGKFSLSDLDSPGDFAMLALDIGTDFMSPGLTSALSKPITKRLTAQAVANAIDDAVVTGGGDIIKHTLSKEAAEKLAKNSIEFSVTFSDEFVVSASRIGGNRLSDGIATKAIAHVGDDIVGQGVNYHNRVLTGKGKYHNFPKIFDEHIIKNGSWSQRIKDKANWFELPGSVNGTNGVYQIGVNGKNTIFHKNFVPF